ncbi:hypothetical protein BGZ65_001562 [Modicella reniformis]|uniref:Ion transport domain-containing protein n=1 Tax=Modicella reniformis TaxID=1440133 RepID=A0A9P6MA09_9FUNG|nr:hypothetical protein BGZ65_001562 [Modicella reniformis]
MKVNRVPVPNIGKTILAFFREGRFKNKGLVCEADGSKIHCYVSHDPFDIRATGAENNLVDPTGMFYTLIEGGRGKEPKVRSMEQFDGNGTEGHEEGYGEGMKRYELRMKQDEKLFLNGDGLKYWIARVEVVEENQGNNKVIFSFVPEPWMRVSTADVGNPVDLQRVYFLSGGTRFVVAGMQTLQIWSFPSVISPYFSLDFIWSCPRMVEDLHSQPYGESFNSELVGEYYHCISQPKIYQDESTGSAVAHFEMKDGTERHIRIPTASGSNIRSTFVYCARSIHLLAAAYAYSLQETKKSGDPLQNTFTFEGHVKAIAQFTRSHINRVLSDTAFYKISEAGETIPTLQDDHPENSKHKFAVRALTIGVANLTKGMRNPDQRKPVGTVLTLLLGRCDLKEANHTFVECLLSLDGGRWVPHADISLNPIAYAISIEDEELLKVLIDFCINCAKKYHPCYMTPVEQCLTELLKSYPRVAAYVFKSTSYILAHNHAYVASHAIGTITRLQDLIRVVIKATLFSNKTTPKQLNIDDNIHAVFTLRSQLPTVHSPPPFMNEGDISHHWSETRFTQRRDVRPTLKNRSHKIYVSPFQFRLIMSTVNRSQDTWFKSQRNDSVFDYITEKDFYDNPAVVTILRFKWFKFGIKYWLMRFSPLFIIFILMAVITANLINVYAMKKEEPLLASWKYWVLHYFSWGVTYTPIRHIKKKVVSSEGRRLRVFKALGIAFNIITNITRRIAGFIGIIIFCLVAFTHILLYVLHSPRYHCQENSCLVIEDHFDFPLNLFSAFSATLFFVAGRYDPVDAQFAKGDVYFIIVIMIFYFVTATLLLNILIALMNDAFNDSLKEGERDYWKLLSRVVAETETLIKLTRERERSDYYPKHIYYYASEEEVEKFHLKYSISHVSGLSAENRFVVESSEAAASSIQRTINDNITALGKDMVERSRRQDEELAEMRMLVERPRGYNEMKQELSELKKHVASSHGGIDEVKQELAELKKQIASSRDTDKVQQELADLKELVKDFMFELRSKNAPS